MTTKLYGGDAFEHRGHTFRVTVERDDYMGEPWKEHDGHGPVSDWTSRDKKAGELVLATDRHSKRYYDFRAATKLALRDGWGVRRPGTDDYTRLEGETKRAYAARAALADFEHLKAWCDGSWEWQYVRVELLDDHGDATGDFDGVGGVEDPDGSYLSTLARECADNIIGTIEVEHPDVVLSVN